MVAKCQPVALNLLNAGGVMGEVDGEEEIHFHIVSNKNDFMFLCESALEQLQMMFNSGVFHFQILDENNLGCRTIY